MKFKLSVANEILKKLLANNSTGPLTYPLYLSLHSADPGTTGANEVSAVGANGYSRISLNNVGFTISGRTATNDGSAEWTLDIYVRVTHLGFFDLAATLEPTSNFIMAMELETPVWFYPGRLQRFSAGALQMTIPDGLSDFAAELVLDYILNGVDFTGGGMWLSFHNANPGLTGANEADVPRAELQDGNWEASAAQVGDEFELETSESISEVSAEEFDMGNIGIWDDETAGNFIMRGTSNVFPVAIAETIENSGTVKAVLNQNPA